jgi:DNA-binding MarR family transcriptional regulator
LFARDVPHEDARFRMRQRRTAAGSAAHRLRVLKAMDGAGNVSQRLLAARVGLGLSQVNRIIRALLTEGHVRVVDPSVRPYAYRLTPEGRAYLRLLLHEEEVSVVRRFREVQRRLHERLLRIHARGVESVVFYGAGEVMEVARPLAEALGLRVIAVVDDDPAKQGRSLGFLVVQAPASISETGADGVVITALRHAAEIRSRLSREVPAGIEVVDL